MSDAVLGYSVSAAHPTIKPDILEIVQVFVLCLKECMWFGHNYYVFHCIQLVNFDSHRTLISTRPVSCLFEQM